MIEKPKTKSAATSPKTPGLLKPKQSPKNSIMNFIKKQEPLPEISQVSRWKIHSFELPIYSTKLFVPQKISLQYFTQNTFTPTKFTSPQKIMNDISDPLVQALIENGIDPNSANLSRRTLIAFFDTAAYYKFSQQQLNLDAQKLKHLIQQSQVTLGHSSTFLPGRVFFGLAQIEKIDFLDPLKIYENIDYEAQTAIFADSEDQSSSESESSEEINDEKSEKELLNLPENELYIKLAGRGKVDADDIDQEDMIESKNQSLKQQKMLYDFLCKKQDLFDYPVIQLCPEGISQAKSVLYSFEGICQNQNKKDVQIIKGAIPKHLLPLFFNVGKQGQDLQSCFNDQDYVVEFEKEIDE
ncbi:hypothetical protein SS50377_21997 [Spironucleus salmonicida]|uniref:Uncharacterized protein n=1 Tax=Spironucleus salmonicida TaxID=348837 RepID=V6LNM0_9EUKA|nr:hypothetical protein SS50377_21997 [Spironucleus salmonicida]|eukprot:EST45838.1 hypothetical protein SS50377_14413 [Spironucleus salmonicida]